MDIGMYFEMTMRLLFGQKAYQTAGSEMHPGHRRAWLQKAVRQFMRLVNGLETTPRHKQILMTDLEGISEALKGTREASWEPVLSPLAAMHASAGIRVISWREMSHARLLADSATALHECWRESVQHR